MRVPKDINWPDRMRSRAIHAVGWTCIAIVFTLAAGIALVFWGPQPPWVGVVMGIVFPVLWFAPVIQYQRKAQLLENREFDGLCLSCGFDLVGNTSGVCPNCGRRVDFPDSVRSVEEPEDDITM
jgi:hypothetical protein